MEYSKYQKDIFDWISSGTGNAIIDAVAGSGKTTTIIESLNFIPKESKVLFLSFNTAIKNDTRHKIDKMGIKGVTVSTNHGFGYQILSSVGNFKSAIRIDKRKYNKLSKNVIWEDMRETHETQEEHNNNRRCKKPPYGCKKCKDVFWARVLAMSTLLEYARIFSIPVSHPNFVHEVYKKMEHIDAEDVSFLQSVSDWVGMIQVYQKIVKLGETLDSVDFLDMICLPVQMSIQIHNNFDFVFLDECQDLNTAQINLVKYTLEQTNARLIAVGDPDQAIYGFTGSLPDSWHKVRDAFFAKEFPLSVCYRCGRRIVEKAQKIVPKIEIHKDSQEGILFPESDLRVFDILDKKINAVLCRFTAPLVSILCEAISGGIDNFKLLGRDISDLIKGFIRQSVGKIDDDDDENECHEKKISNSLREKIEKFFAKKILEEKKERRKKYLQDMRSVALYFEGISNHTDIGIIELIEKYFVDTEKKGEIVLSTIHKAKGREWDSVYVAQFEDMPCYFKDQKNWSFQQEINLKYIAITRAKKNLFLGIRTRGCEACPKSYPVKDEDGKRTIYCTIVDRIVASGTKEAKECEQEE